MSDVPTVHFAPLLNEALEDNGLSLLGSKPSLGDKKIQPLAADNHPHLIDASHGDLTLQLDRVISLQDSNHITTAKSPKSPREYNKIIQEKWKQRKQEHYKKPQRIKKNKKSKKISQRREKHIDGSPRYHRKITRKISTSSLDTPVVAQTSNAWIERISYLESQIEKNIPMGGNLHMTLLTPITLLSEQNETQIDEACAPAQVLANDVSDSHYTPTASPRLISARSPRAQFMQELKNSLTLPLILNSNSKKDTSPRIKTPRTPRKLFAQGVKKLSPKSKHYEHPRSDHLTFAEIAYLNYGVRGHYYGEKPIIPTLDDIKPSDFKYLFFSELIPGTQSNVKMSRSGVEFTSPCIPTFKNPKGHLYASIQAGLLTEKENALILNLFQIDTREYNTLTQQHKDLIEGIREHKKTIWEHNLYKQELTDLYFDPEVDCYDLYECEGKVQDAIIARLITAK